MFTTRLTMDFPYLHELPKKTNWSAKSFEDILSTMRETLNRLAESRAERNLIKSITFGERYGNPETLYDWSKESPTGRFGGYLTHNLSGLEQRVFCFLNKDGKL